MEGMPEQEPAVRRPWSARRKLLAVVLAAVLVASVVAMLLFYPSSPFRERTVSYEYTVTIDSASLDEFVLICPIPVDEGGSVCPDVLPSLVVEGDVTVSEVTTDHGPGLRVVGEGSAVMTWSHSYTYRTSTQSLYDHYSNLSMLDAGYSPQTAFIHLEGPDVYVDIEYVYEHMYDTATVVVTVPGGELLVYDVRGDMMSGWNTVPVDFEHVGVG